MKLHRNVWILGWVSLLMDFGTKMSQSLLPLFLVSTLGANTLTLGLIEGTAEATGSLLKLGSGTLSDYWGKRKHLAIAGYGLSALVAPILALANHPLGIFLARFGDRVGKGLRVAPRNALVADVTAPDQRGAAYGLRQSLDTVGAFSGPLIATVLMYYTGQNYRLIFAIACLPACISVFLLVVAVDEPPHPFTTPKTPWHLKSFAALGKDYWFLLLVALIFNLGNFSDAFLLLRASQVGVPDPLVPLGLVVMNLTYSLSAYPIGYLSDRFSRLNILKISFFLFALIYLGFALAQTSTHIWILFALSGLYLGLSQGTLLALVADFAPPPLRGQAFGLLGLVIGLTLFLSSAIAGFLWQTINSQVPFLLGACLSIFSLITLLFTVKNIPYAQ